MKNQRKAYLYALTAVGFWSTVASAFKISLQYMDSLHLLFYATIVSLICLFIILVFQNNIKQITKFTKNDYLNSAVLGFLNPFLYYVILFKAYSLLPAQEAQPLNYTWPIMLALLSVPLLKQKMNVRSIFAIIVSFIGIFIISTRGDILSFRFTNLPGAILAISSSVVWALFWIYNLKDKRDETGKLFLNFVFGFIYILIAMLLFSKIHIPEFKGILGVTYVGLFEMGLTFLFWSRALHLSKTTAMVSNLVFLSPFLSLILIHFIVGETIFPSTVIGLIFIIAGILLQQYNNRSSLPEHA